MRRVAGSQLSIDIVVHEAGVAASWARDVAVGARIAVTGADGRYGADEPTDWELIAADMTGLPAALRILEELPEHRSAVAVLEVHGPDDGSPLLLIAGLGGLARVREVLFTDSATQYVATGRRVPSTWIWRRLTRR